MSWVAIAVGASAVVGGAVSMAGAKKNAQAIDKANQSNNEQAERANQWNYQMWLEKNGVGANGTPINTVLPRWLGVSTGSDGTKRAAVLNSAQMGGSAQDVVANIGTTPQTDWTKPEGAANYLSRKG